ncbi:hypothetical protein [Hymenobacter canadensis]|uniref:DUF4468 domain-containing protein n=1 Tax=Hymenobacter canadensis TaxID=2999067 RepID=A0ABY7LUW7_9BACT|nr:hypothetical protein [Hymenobacter canadensis]WBA43722.1 hypothetical protein O3303_09155 [Hymenobacter canadensis]
MRLFLLIISLLIPQALMAQFNSFEAGSYRLAADKTVHHEARIKLRGSSTLIVKDAKGGTSKYTPANVLSFQLGARKFISVRDFDVEMGLASQTIDEAFVQLLDSGALVLMRYEFTVGGPMMVGAGGSMSGGGSSTYEVYLLRWNNELSIAHIPANRLTGGGPKFRDALVPYLRQRPDLSKLVENKQVTIDNLPAIVRAFNSGQPYAAVNSTSTSD